MSNKHIGSSFDSLLEEMGIKEEVDLRAKKKILAEQMLARMKVINMTKAALAKIMKTNRPTIDRLLDGDDTGVTFNTLAKVSNALNMDLLISLEPRKQRRKAASKR